MIGTAGDQSKRLKFVFVHFRIHQIAFCDTVIERNNRSVLPVVSSQPADQAKGPLKLTSVNPLDSFFPFDPYLLKR